MHEKREAHTHTHTPVVWLELALGGPLWTKAQGRWRCADITIAGFMSFKIHSDVSCVRRGGGGR